MEQRWTAPFAMPFMQMPFNVPQSSLRTTTSVPRAAEAAEDALAASRARALDLQTLANTKKNAKTHVQCVFPKHRGAAVAQLRAKGVEMEREAEDLVVAVIDNNKVQTDYGGIGNE